MLYLIAEVDRPALASPPELDLGLPPRLLARRRGRTPARGEALEAVTDFHVAFDLPVQPRPRADISAELGRLRVELLREEFEELADAVQRADIVAIADALADVVYVSYGTALTYGIDLDAVFREVHRANMSKLGSDGRPLLRADGKVMKAAAYAPPDVARVLLDQPPLFLD